MPLHNHVNILYRLYDGSTHLFSLENENFNPQTIRKSISLRENLPEEAFSIEINGKHLETSEQVENQLDNNDFVSVQIFLPILGGKGGFGSMLRAIGAQIEKTTNKEACRDLSGRRLKDINAEKKIKAWVAKQGKLKEERLKKRKEKMKKLREEPKIIFQDNEYFKTREEIPQITDDAVEEGLKGLPATNVYDQKPVPSTSAQKFLPLERSKEMKPEISKKGLKKVRGAAWMGVDLDEDETSDDEAPSKSSIEN